MDTSTDFAAAHPRTRDGKFTDKPVDEAAGGLDALTLAGAHEPDEQDQEPAPGQVHVFASHRLPEAIERIEAANKRLARAGIEERFEFETTQDVRPVIEQAPDGTQTTHHMPFTTLTLNAPAISFSGYRFMAAVESEDAGLVTRVARGENLDGWTPTSMECAHCGRTQQRATTYLVQDEAGERTQLGSTCVQAFLGVRPTGLWALGYDPVEGVGEDDDEPGAGSFSNGRSVTPVEDVLALSLAISHEEGFVSRSRAEMTGEHATSGKVLAAIYPSPRERPEERAWRERIRERAAQLTADGEVDALRDYIEEGIDDDSDWGHNVRTVTRGEWVGAKNLGLLVSAVSPWAWHKDRKAYVPPTPGFAAPVGEKVKGMGVTVAKVHHMTEHDPYQRMEVTKTLLLMRDEAGHELKWFASRRQEVEVGAKITLTGGAVKSHGEYQGTDQTVLTRVKFDVLDGD
ncbi:hypothetical protein [Oerskovia enterophila]|uniref:Uncharacterized protein n=1 Tax=Oerskovia enterophila TaxID=43678 RepID=A0ABX2Y884_9CELL|nr:hypothetical protein [Oerskovia enterophila]OCI32803.1 hypothetical protein OERS_03950 [Oerskovia enterophila]